MTLPADHRTAADQDEPEMAVPNRGVSAQEPAEGSDDEPAEQPGSPKG